jgi:cyanophycinase
LTVARDLRTLVAEDGKATEATPPRLDPGRRGGEEKFDRPEILERFVAEAGGAEAKIAILPTASAIPDERATFYERVFRQIGAGEAFPLPIATRDDASAPANLETIDRATGVFMTGGDQSRLVAALADSPALDAIRAHLIGGGALAGTSPGRRRSPRR